MEFSPTEIEGIWVNLTNAPLAVTVNGNKYTGPIQAQEASRPMSMYLDERMMLNVVINNVEIATSLNLLWIGEQVEDIEIMQQAHRYEPWTKVPITARLLPFYIFQLRQTDDGLLIVGTVELVEIEAMARAASR